MDLDLYGCLVFAALTVAFALWGWYLKRLDEISFDRHADEALDLTTTASSPRRSRPGGGTSREQ